MVDVLTKTAEDGGQELSDLKAVKRKGADFRQMVLRLEKWYYRWSENGEVEWGLR